jgi:hypothetical protein
MLQCLDASGEASYYSNVTLELRQCFQPFCKPKPTPKITKPRVGENSKGTASAAISTSKDHWVKLPTAIHLYPLLLKSMYH